MKKQWWKVTLRSASLYFQWDPTLVPPGRYDVKPRTVAAACFQRSSMNGLTMETIDEPPPVRPLGRETHGHQLFIQKTL